MKHPPGNFPAICGVLLALAPGCLRAPPGLALDPGILLLSSSSGSSGGGSTVAAPEFGNLVATYPGHTGWNDYIENDGTSRFTATDTACAGTATGGHSHCIHAGMMRTIPVSNRTTCSGLTTLDSESALIWFCDDSSGTVNLTSTGFIPGRGLYNLIDFSTGAWKSLSLTVSDSGGSATASLGQLWINPISLNPTGTPINANVSGTIYAFNASPGQQVLIGADKVAVVSDQNFRWEGPGASDMIAATNFKYLWIEPGWMDGRSADNRAINLSGVTYSVIQLARIQQTNFTGVWLQASSNNNLLYFVSLSDNVSGTAGIYLQSSSYNTLGHIRASNLTIDGINVDGGSNNTIFNTLTANNGSNNLHFTGGTTNNAALNITSTNSPTTGIALNGSSHDNYLASVALSNNLTGLAMAAATTSHRQTIVNIAATNSATGLDIGTNNNFITDTVRLGDNTANCTGGAGTGIASSTCLAEGTASSFTRLTGYNLSTSFPNRIFTDDITNGDDTSGSAAATGITDWVNFDNLFRLWGVQGSTFANPDNRGHCNATTCHIFDWSLNASDSQIRNVQTQPTGNDAVLHRWNASNQTECETIALATWAANSVCSLPGYFTAGACTGAGGDWASDKCFSVLLRNAYELLGDGLGNENGLCESFELCVYSPNIGAYQGEGSFTDIGPITNGTVQGVYLIQYATNGQ